MSDSRLSGDGRTFDHCPKVLPLPRSDCAIAFAGYTQDAYPLMHQLSLAIQAFSPLQSRAMDLRELRTHALKIFDSMSASVKSGVSGVSNAADGAEFLFGGYSWTAKQFFVWRIAYSQRKGGFVAHKAPRLLTSPMAKKAFFGNPSSDMRVGSRCLGHVAFAGDQGTLASANLLELITRRYSQEPSRFENGSLDFEPFEVVRDMLRDPQKAQTIGGAPQVLKVYQHMNARPLAVAWPDAHSRQIFIQGRPLLGYENVDYWTLDPDTFHSSHKKGSDRPAPGSSAAGLVPATGPVMDRNAE